MPLIWVAITFPILLLLQRWIHTHLHGVSLLLMGKSERAVILYALILFPGVFLHEASHWLMATLIGVRTGRFSVIPRQQADGSLQLGYVEYYKGRNVGAIRESLIGGAPLIAGTAVILLIGFKIFNLPDLISAIQIGDSDIILDSLSKLMVTNDFFVWLYLLFAISNAMMPSASDRRAWPAFLLMMGGLSIILYLLGIQGIVLQELATPVTLVFTYLGLAYSMAIAVDLVFMGIIAIFESFVSRLRGVSVVYGGQVES